MQAPMTVAELAGLLAKMDPDALVMIECADSYYSNPLTAENVGHGEASLMAPFALKGDVLERGKRAGRAHDSENGVYTNDPENGSG